MLWTTRVASQTYRIPAGTIRRWHAEGRLINHGSGRRALWSPSALSELCTHHRVAARARRTAA